MDVGIVKDSDTCQQALNIISDINAKNDKMLKDYNEKYGYYNANLNYLAGMRKYKSEIYKEKYQKYFTLKNLDQSKLISGDIIILPDGCSNPSTDGCTNDGYRVVDCNKWALECTQIRANGAANLPYNIYMKQKSDEIANIQNEGNISENISTNYVTPPTLLKTFDVNCCQSASVQGNIKAGKDINVGIEQICNINGNKSTVPVPPTVPNSNPTASNSTVTANSTNTASTPVSLQQIIQQINDLSLGAKIGLGIGIVVIIVAIIVVIIVVFR
jgi:hypothetical protein